MAVAQLLLVVAVLLRCTSAVPACPESCTCLSPTQLNCSSSGLTSVPGHIPDSVAELDLSDNLLDAVTIDQQRSHLRNVRLGNNSITHLSLCTDWNLGGRYVRGRRLHHLGPWRRRGCVAWAPSLQLLSAERNQLEQLPEGLKSCESLQVLQLSFNRISTLPPGDLDHLTQLKELHLKHNLITSLHPQTFRGLARLQVLDLSFNMLTSLHPSMYLPLHNIGADVRLAGNRWKCDCRMRSLKRWMAFDISKGLQAWSVVCASPSSLSGQDLLHLEDDDLSCLTTDERQEHYQDVTVFSGSKMLLSCYIQDLARWEPSGEASAGQPEDGPLTKAIRERDSGRYVCISEEGEVVQKFNLQISRVQDALRRARSLPGRSDQIFSQNQIGNERNQRATTCNLALAVCLSILFSFIVAFILGVLARPCIDNLLKKLCKKKSPTTTNTVSTVEQRQYDNEAYCDVDEHGMAGNHRERRVTFSTVDYREDRNVQYYDTVAGDQGSINDDVFEGEAAAEKRAKTGDSESVSSSQHSSEGNQRDGKDVTAITTNTERRVSSSSSDSSLSDKEKQMQDQRSPQLVNNTVQHTANTASSREVIVSHISTEVTHEIPGFSSEPFEGWSPHSEHINLADPDQWHENEEQFDFSDSARSPSPGSRNVLGPFNEKRDDTSSSSSHLSDDEITHYTVNSDPEDNVRDTGFHQDDSIEQQSHAVDVNRPSLSFIRPDVTKARSFSSTSSESDGAEHDKGVGNLESGVKIEPMPRTKRLAPLPPKACSSSSSSESDTEDKTLQVEQKFGEATVTKIQFQESQTAGIVLETQRPSLDLDHSTHFKRQGGIIAHSPDSYSFSSSSSESDGERHRVKQEKDRGVGKVEAIVVNREMVQPMPRTKRNAPPPPKARSSSSSSDSDVGNKNLLVGQRLGETHITKIQFQEPLTASIVLESQRPSLDLEHSKHIKIHDGIKVPSPDSNSSSSSDSEDETKLRPGTVVISDLAVEKLQTGSHVPDGQWPALDLGHIPRVKRRLDIKRKSQNCDSSSSSDSEEKTTGHIAKQGQKKTETARVPTALKSDTSSSSDSEDESVVHQVQSGKVVITDLAVNKPQTGSRDPDGQWPSLDLLHIPKVKRRLDIKKNSRDSDPSSSSDNDIEKKVQQQTETARVPKALGSSSSSSSDSEDESVVHQVQSGKVVMTDLAANKPQIGSRDPDGQWPSLDLLHIPKVKRRLDIKRNSQDSNPSSSSDNDIEKKVQQQTETARVQKALGSSSSSSSDSEDESVVHQVQSGKVVMTDLAANKPQTGSRDPEGQWPSLDLLHIPKVKRRLDIKKNSQDSDPSSSSDNDIEKKVQQQTETARVPKALGSSSSSSSDSEDESVVHQVQSGKVVMTDLAANKPQTGSRDPDGQWPSLDLLHTPKVKRRLDIKRNSRDSDPSSSSDNDIKKKVQQQTETARVPKALGSSSSSSSDSEDESTVHQERPGKAIITDLAIQKLPMESNDPEGHWPSLDLGHIPKVKRHLDIKRNSRDSDPSSSSDESTSHIKTQQKNMAKVSVAVNKIVSHDQWTERPGRAPSTVSDSSSSSDSEDETKKQGQVHMGKIPVTETQTLSTNPQTQWPLLDLQHIASVKRRLDFKARSAASSSSSSSDSENESIHTEKPGKVVIPGLAIDKPTTGSYNPDAKWPTLDLGHLPKVKRHLAFKAPSPAYSSSSDSEHQSPNFLKKEVLKQTEGGKVTHDLETKRPVKAASTSSSSSESEDELIHTETPGKVVITGLATEKPQTGSYVPNAKWPSLDLGHIPKVKRRLDIKVPSPASDSSFSGESEGETPNLIKKEVQKQTEGARVTIISHDLETKRPVKAQSSASKSSSSSDSDIDIPGRRDRPGKVVSPALVIRESQSVEILSPTLVPTPHSDSSSSSDSENETAKNIKKPEPLVEVSQTNWPLLDLQHTSSIKRRLDFKAQSPKLELTSSSDSEDETSWKRRVHLSKSPTLELSSRLPGLAKSIAPKVKSSNDTQGQISPSKSSSSSSQSEGEATDMHVKVEREKTTLHELNTSIPLFKPHFNAKAPSQPEESSSSSSESDPETKDHAAISKTREEEFIKMPTYPVIEVPLSPKTDPYIKLEKYNIMTGNFEQKSGESFSITPAINPELESRWATMSLGVSRFRKRIEITSKSHAQTPPNLPSSPPPDSPTSSSSSDSGNEGERRTTQRRREIKGSVKTDSFPKADISTISLSFRGQVGPKKEADTRETSSSSDSENDMIDHSVPDLSRGVPQIKRRLNIKAPLPERRSSLSSSSEAEVREYTVKQSRQISTMSHQRDTDTLITYKRSIFQATSPPSSPPPVSDLSMYETKLRHSETAHQGPSYSVGDSTTSSKKSLSRSFDDLLNKIVGHPKRSTELPPELKWTGLSHQMSEPPISSPRRRLDVSSPLDGPELPPTRSSSSSSSSESDDETKQDKGKSDITTQKYSFRASSMSTTRTADNVDRTSLSTNEILRSLSEDKRERRGLSALKAMSSERQQWDLRDKTLGIGTSHLLDDSRPNDEIDYHYQRSTRTQVYLSSTPIEEKRGTDLSYGVPSYRRHGFEVDEPPQETPPPVPATPPPSDEALGLTWRSRPNSWKERSEGTRSFWRQSLDTSGSGPSSPILDSSKNPISKV